MRLIRWITGNRVSLDTEMKSRIRKKFFLDVDKNGFMVYDKYCP